MNRNVFEDLEVCGLYVDLLSNAANMAIAENTKSQYRTAIRHINRIESELKIDMSLPFTFRKTLNYVEYFINNRK